MDVKQLSARLARECGAADIGTNVDGSRQLMISANELETLVRRVAIHELDWAMGVCATKHFTSSVEDAIQARINELSK